MSAVPLSIRLPELADRAGRSNMPSRTLAQRYVEEVCAWTSTRWSASLTAPRAKHLYVPP
jgi:hypothetical protein